MMLEKKLKGKYDGVLHSLGKNLLDLANENFENEEFLKGIEYLREIRIRYFHSDFFMSEIENTRKRYISNIIIIY